MSNFCGILLQCQSTYLCFTRNFKELSVLLFQVQQVVMLKMSHLSRLVHATHNKFSATRKRGIAC